MTNAIDLHDLQADLVALLARVGGGEHLVVHREGRPVAELRPVPRPARAPRPFGLALGEFVVPADFDAQLPDEVLRAFEGR